MENYDPRVVRTRSNLRKALMQLMKENTLANISVQKITEKAKITRGTFYLHYKDKQDFVETTIDGILEDFFRDIIFYRENPKNPEQQIPVLSLQKTFEIVEAEHETYEVLLEDEENLKFTQHICEKIAGYMKNYHQLASISGDSLSVPLDLTISYVVTGMIGFIMNWLNGGLIYTPRFMAKTLKKLTESESMREVQLEDFFILSEEVLEQD